MLLSGHLRTEARVSTSNPVVISDFRQVYEAVALPVLIIDHETWRILAVNEAALEQYGYEREEFVGLPVLEVRPPEGRAEARRVMSEAPHGFWRTTAVLHSRKDGSVFSADVWSRDAVVDGRSVRIVTIHEVTERIQLQQELQQAQKMEVVGRLAGGVAHDVNNALTTIIGAVNLLLDDFRGDPQTSNDLESVLTAARRVSLLTRRLLAFSRQQVMRVETLSLADVVARSVAMLDFLEDHVELRTRIDPGSWNVRVDAVQFEQVILNLAVNAQDAMPGGGTLLLATGNFSISPQDASNDPSVPPGDYAVLIVEDTGIGMDEITRGRAFEPFFTSKPPPEGTGLGLSTAYGIVRQSGGYIKVESEPGVGTTFRILLPRVGGSDAKAALLGESAARGARTAVVVEADEGVRRSTSRVLEGMGDTVISAGSGEDVVEMLEASDENPHLLVSALSLPGMDGRELADCLQATDPDMGVLLLSGYALEADRLNTVAGGRRVLSRPFSVESLTEAVRRVLEYDS
ncbi:hypothetical protein BH23GEM11_BH23GEM11_06120 [soil metagenome]